MVCIWMELNKIAELHGILDEIRKFSVTMVVE